MSLFVQCTLHMGSSARIYKASPMDFLKFSGSRTPANNTLSNYKMKT